MCSYVRAIHRSSVDATTGDGSANSRRARSYSTRASARRPCFSRLRASSERIRAASGGLPLVLKGVVRVDDAERAVEEGCAGIWVSNHGGRQLDGAIAPLDALPEIAEAIGGRATIILDGGVRRGTDVLKAIALGADAVAIGRPIYWGLAVGGALGVQQVIETLRRELDAAMALAGCPRIADIDRSLVG